MPDQLGTITDRLTDVVRIITFSRKSGVLMAERTSSNGPEKIRLLFSQGHIIDTDTYPYYQGPDVLNWLQAWGSCRFKFENALNNQVKTLHPTASNPSVQPTNPVFPNTPYSLLPTSPYQTDPLRRIEPGTAQQQTDPQYQLPPGMAYQFPDQHTPNMPTGPIQRIPQRRYNNEDSMRLLTQQKVSRIHRQIFLLVDNQRTSQEIARLTSRRLDEVYVLLTDLEQAGLIHS